MSKLIKDQEAFLRFLHNSKLSQKQRKELFRTASKEQIHALCECAFNILRKNVPLSSEQLKTLRKPKYKKTVYVLGDRKASLSKKKKALIKQDGGFPFALLAPIIGGIIGALT